MSATDNVTTYHCQFVRSPTEDMQKSTFSLYVCTYSEKVLFCMSFGNLFEHIVNLFKQINNLFKQIGYTSTPVVICLNNKFTYLLTRMGCF